MSSTDTGPNATGRWGIRTHDPLIKSPQNDNDKHNQDKNLQQNQKGAYKPAYKPSQMAAENTATPLPSELAEIASVWSGLPEHIRQTIKTLVSVTVQKDNEIV